MGRLFAYAQFHPALLGGRISKYEVRLLALPARFSGFGVIIFS